MKVLAHFLLWSAGCARPETQTTDAERDCLARHAAGKRRVVEIGVWHGVTTSRLRSVMCSDGVLSAVDPFPVGRLGFSAQRWIAHHEVGKVPNGRVHWLRTTGVQAAGDHEAVDFVFIDADHSDQSVRADWEAWSPLIASDGIVAIHDSRSTPSRHIDDAGSVRVTRDVILHDPCFELVEVVDSLTVLRRSPSGRSVREPCERVSEPVARDCREAPRDHDRSRDAGPPYARIDG